MKKLGKSEVDTYCNEENYSHFRCKKHPKSPSSGGICPYCLSERLYQLICQQCGENRLSSCSCTDLYSKNNGNSCSSSDVGSVGRISFLLENDKLEVSGSKTKIVDDFANLRRSNSICVERKESSKEKFGKIGRFFRKMREKTNNGDGYSNCSTYECNGVSRSRSRSRSLCSFRGFYDTEESGNLQNNSTKTTARASSVSTSNFLIDSAKRSCFSESEARFSNFDYYDTIGFNKNNNKNIFPSKQTEFVNCDDDPAYIDLKLNETASSGYQNKVHLQMARSMREFNNTELGGLKRSGYGGNDDGMGHEMFRNGSCRSTSGVAQRELKKCRKSYKVWRWFFRYQNSSSRGNVEDFYNHGFN